MCRPEACCGFSPSSASLFLRSTSQAKEAAKKKRRQQSRIVVESGWSFECELWGMSRELFSGPIHGRFHNAVNHLVNALSRKAEVVGENRKRDLFPFGSYGVSGERFHPAQRAGLRIYVLRGIEVLATIGQRAIHIGR